jgi:hypothetical protein
VSAGDTGRSPWSGRSHAELATLTRELLLAGHMIDRASMPHLIGAYGPEEMRDVAIDEWMAASPVYTKRAQRLLGFEGDTVEVIFKGMQFDVGAPPEFLDFRYEVVDDHHGRFHLDHCGALMDVEPMGDELVRIMCHDIEDPTFDATATATNPRAQVRPVHRPPRAPADRNPHCEWTVTIVPEAEPLATPAGAVSLSSSKAGSLPLSTPPADLPTDDGDADYAGPLDPDLVAERFSSATLATILDEVGLQCQLLSRAGLVAVAERWGGDAALALGRRQLTGVAGLATKRLAAALGVGKDLAGVAEVLAVHPAFLPRAYVALRLEAAADELRVAIDPCPALEEGDGLTWAKILVDGGAGGDSALAAAVQCLLPTAQVARTGATSWRIWDDPSAPPAPDPEAVLLTEFSTGAQFAFQRVPNPTRRPT